MNEQESQEGPTGDKGAEERVASNGSPIGRRQGAYVLDSSALLRLMNSEPGADRVAAVLPRAFISAVDLAEVSTRLNDLRADAEEARALLAPLHLAVAPFVTAALRAATRGQGPSLEGRACLALAAERGATAFTTDGAWQDAGEVVGVEMLR